MCAQMSSPGDKEPPKEWWYENACRIAAFRLRNQKYIGVNVSPVREQIRDAVEFVRVVWEEIDRHMQEEDKPMMKSSLGNRLSNAWTCPYCITQIDTRTFRLSPTNIAKLVCTNPMCGRKFLWRAQNKGKLWPEQRAYNVLR